MPRDASSSAFAGPGPSTVASRSASASTSSASASRSSSTRSSPANDLFRISLPDHTENLFSGPEAFSGDDFSSYLANTRRALALAGSARFQDILEEASADLRTRFSSANRISEKDKKRMFDEFLREMKLIAEMQEREVEARAREEAVLAKTMMMSKSQNTAGPSGGSGGSASAFSSSPGSGSSSSLSTGSGGSSGVNTASSSTSSASKSAVSVKDVDDGSSTEEETDRPTPAKLTKAKVPKAKAGKLPPSLNTTPNNSKRSAPVSKKGMAKDDDALSSSPSTPMPGRRGRSGTISLPRSVSASSAFPDDSVSSLSGSSHNKTKSSDSVNASLNPITRGNANSKEGASDGVKIKPKGVSKSATVSPHVGTRPELLAGLGVSSSSTAGSTVPAHVQAKSSAAKIVFVAQNQKPIQTQRGPTSASAVQPPVQSRANTGVLAPATNTNANSAKKGTVQQNSNASTTNLATNATATLKSPRPHSQAFQLAQAQIQHSHHSHPSQTQTSSRIHPPNNGNTVVARAQDDSILGYRPNKENSEADASVGANHKLWIPPKPPHMQSPANAGAEKMLTSKEASANAKEGTKVSKHSKEGNESKESNKESKEKRARPVSFASQGIDALNLNTKENVSASASVPVPVSASSAEKIKNDETHEKGDSKDAKHDGEKKGVAIEKEVTSMKETSPPLTTASVPASAIGTSTQAPRSGSVAAQVSSTTGSRNASGVAVTPPQLVKGEARTPGVPVAPVPTSTTTEKKAGTANSSPQPLPGSVPPTPNMVASGLSCASASEAAAAEIERERRRFEKEWATTGADGKLQPQTLISPCVTQPYAYTQSATHAHAPSSHQQHQSPQHQKGLSVDTTYSHPYPFAHANAATNSSGGTTGMMSLGASGSTVSTSTITSPFSPLSILNNYSSSSAATSAVSSRAISRHASSSSSDPYAQKDNHAHAQSHSHHGRKEKDKLAEAAAALMIGVQPPTQANMFWQPGPNEREREQRERERERDRNHGRTPSANNNASHGSSASASAASSRSSSVSRSDGPGLFGGYDPSTIRPTGSRSGHSPLLQAGGNGSGNAGLEVTFASLMDGAPGDKGSGNGKTGYDTKIWVPGPAGKDSTPKPSRRGERDRDANSSASSPPVHPLALTLSSLSSSSASSSLVPSTASTISNTSASQAQFYAVAERAREDRLRLRANEFHSRAEVVAVFQQRVEELMAEFAEALMHADEYEKFGPSSALTKPGSY